jgi:hypothetical protein
MIRALAIASLAALVGCASRPAPPPARPAEGPLLAVGPALPAAGSIADGEAFPRGPGTTRWLAARGSDPTVAEAVAVEVTARPAAGHGASFARDIPGESTDWLSAGPEGTELHAVLSPADAALSIFATPLRLLPATLPAGAEHRASAAMEVVEADDPARRKDRGTGERIARYAHDAEITVAGRTLRARVLESTFTARLRSATATRTTELFVVPGLGPVAERWKREVLVLGLVRTVREGVRVRDLSDLE